MDSLLGPGNYTLWLFDFPAKHLPNYDGCAPVSLQFKVEQMNDDENFISCRAIRIPTDLNTPGMLDHSGYIHFREDVFLDLSTSEHVVKFKPTKKSLFRGFSEAHRVDIDLEVRDATSGTSLARTYRGKGKEENVVLELVENNAYEFVVHYYGTYDAIFCEDFLLEFEVLPLDPLYKVDACGTVKSSLPDFGTGLTAASNLFELKRQNFHYFLNASKSRQDIIVSQNITVTKTMRLTVGLDSRFIDGLNMHLYAPDTNPIHPFLFRNRQEIDALLVPDTTYTDRKSVV